MRVRSVAALAVILLGAFASGQAWAFSGDNDREDSSTSDRSEPAEEQPSANYRYSGNSFDFSMTRSPDASGSQQPARDVTNERGRPPQNRPGFIQRSIRTVFGD